MASMTQLQTEVIPAFRDPRSLGTVGKFATNKVEEDQVSEHFNKLHTNQ